MYHESNGLFFDRLQNGSVRIIKTTDGKDPNEGNILFQQDIPENTWASAVCSVSRLGETVERWNAARDFHGR
jgi:hypothetical protein